VQVLKAGGLRGGQQDPFVVAVACVVGPFPSRRDDDDGAAVICEVTLAAAKKAADVRSRRRGGRGRGQRITISAAG
jgi:hypothetical protein